MMNREALIEQILKIAGDYRKGEIAKFDAKHVERWVQQFPVSEKDQNVILHEVGHMLKNYYISKDDAREWISLMFNNMKEERIGGCPITDVTFLRTQDVGKSQHALLLLADEILKDAHGVTTQNCGGSKVYFYLDDCIYSGNKWRYDIKNSTQIAQAPKGIKVVSYHFAMYGLGYHYAHSHINSTLTGVGGTLKPFRHFWYENDRTSKKNLDIIFPTYVKGNKQVDAFVNSSNARCSERGWSVRPLFRNGQSISSNIFSSAQNQHLVEQAFLAAGAKMFCAAQNPAQSMRPMGFEVIGTIGFGTPIVTWRNIANNCPLALWYGDPSYGSNHPLGIWYPLFPRKM